MLIGVSRNLKFSIYKRCFDAWFTSSLGFEILENFELSRNLQNLRILMILTTHRNVASKCYFSYYIKVLEHLSLLTKQIIYAVNKEDEFEIET